MTTQAFTPAYLQREHTAPALLQSADDGAAYTWNEAAGRPLPTTRCLLNRIQPPAAGVAPPGEGEEEEEMEDEEKYPGLPRPRGPEDYYKRVYDDMTKKIAYRWPNPGTPRNREGRIGGTWRHIKEVLGHGGSRFVFVDGLVSVYDDQKFTEKLQAQLPYRPHIRPLYAPFKGESAASAAPVRSSLPAYPILPQVPATSLGRDPNVARKLELQKRFPTQRRGFYGFP
ncbi:uncharacterized protein LOC143301187 [Babylonia areolata]|uniref:uncharacterized protein LOC143301187 n=1 Tax=Babylonia areolata TaxID=304850 RepID=UPI003FD28FDF